MIGRFITFEGCEGVGKSTQVRLLREALEARGVPCLFTREPGGTEVGERIRGLLKDESLDMTDMTELLLFEAARRENTERVIIPALEAGKLPGRAAADCRRSAGRHGRVHEPARKPAPVLCAGGQHRVRHHV